MELSCSLFVGFTMLIVTTIMTGCCTGVVVQAADPRGPDYFRTDLGSTATLQCPGVLGFSMPINSVSWFRGNSTSAAVILDDRTAVSSDGMLVIQTVKKAESGWYFCQYDSPGGPVTGRAHLNVIGEFPVSTHTNTCTCM